MKIKGRILALDVGDKRIGLALSDELQITASPLGTVDNTKAGIAQILKLAYQHSAQLILVGWPLELNGSVGAQAEKVRIFAEKLTRLLKKNPALNALPLKFWDERFSSQEAEELLTAQGMAIANFSARAKAVDELSAVLILEDFLQNASLSN